MEKISYISSLIIGAGIFQGVFQAVVLWRIKKGNQKANGFLALLLLAFSVNIAHSVFFNDIVKPNLPQLLKINEPFQFLLGPLMYFYVRQLNAPSYMLRKKDFLHFIPFLLYGILVMPVTVTCMPSNAFEYVKSNANTFTTLVWGIIFLHIAAYFALVHLQIQRYQARIKACYSEIDKLSLSWLRYFLTILSGIYFIYFILLMILLHLPNQSDFFPHLLKIVALLLSLALYGLGYRGLTQPKIFIYDSEDTLPIGEMKQIAIETSQETVPIKYEHSGLACDEAEELVHTLLTFMEEEKPYLNPELTLPELASMLEISRNRLSQVLNEKLGASFYDFVNGYRVKEVQRLMADTEYQHIKILALAFDAGFNSKATFNSIFKKVAGFTPSEYRKQLENAAISPDLTQQS